MNNIENDKKNLYQYRIIQAKETLEESKRMLKDKYSARSIINRAYYSMFFSLLALFIKSGVNTSTSKHSVVISIFDKEFVKNRKFDKKYSKTLHLIFDKRQEYDYR